jgi:PEGA domain-containing protein
MKRFTNTGRILGVVSISIAAIAAFSLARAQERQAVPRGDKQEASQPRERERRPPRDDAQEPQRRPPDGDQRRAEPRPATPRDDHDRRTADRGQPRRGAAVRPHYAFPPVDARVRFHYHPYFGFYFGPYYGPYYRGTGYAFVRFNEGALRLRVKPVETEVYANGYYAGVVDDFDGVFQRLYLPRGDHQITLRLPGYESHTVVVRVRRGEAIDLVHEMRRLAAGRPDPPPPTPRPLPREWTEPPAIGEEPPTSYGILALHAAPSDAQVIIDGEAWAPVAGQSEFVIHLVAGWHQIEVRREGYHSFSMRVDMIEGQTTRLDASLVQR